MDDYTKRESQQVNSDGDQTLGSTHLPLLVFLIYCCLEEQAAFSSSIAFFLYKSASLVSCSNWKI